MTHSALLAFRQTEKKEFPLILVVGREPNNNSVSDKKVGPYDFTEFPNCAFWNIAFKLLGTYNGLKTVQMKELF